MIMDKKTVFLLIAVGAFLILLFYILKFI